jgi:hypothetical protein
MDDDKDIREQLQELKAAQELLEKRVSVLTEIIEMQAVELEFTKRALSENIIAVKKARKIAKSAAREIDFHHHPIFYFLSLFSNDKDD